MNPYTTETKQTTARSRFLHFLLRVLFWSFLLFIVDKIAEKAEWKEWNEFDRDARAFTEDKLEKMLFLSPLSLYADLRATRTIHVEEPAANKAGEVNSNLKGLLDQSRTSPKPSAQRKVTIWEKVKDWCRNFWYDDKGNANWFGRIILVLALVIAIPLTTVKKKNADNEYKPIGSELYLLNILLALIYLLLFFLALFLLVKLVMLIAGGITAIFSSIAALGGFFKFLSEELKSELVGHGKKKTEEVVGIE